MSVNLLIEQLNAQDAEQLKQAQDKLVAIGTEVVPELLNALTTASTRNQANIIAVLTSIGDSRAINHLCALLSSPSLIVRMSAAKALGSFQDEQVGAALRRHLNDNSEIVRMWVITSLGKLKVMKAIPLLLHLLQTTSSNTTRYMILQALGEYGEPDLAAYVLPYCDHSDHHVRNYAQAALVKLGHQVQA